MTLLNCEGFVSDRDGFLLQGNRINRLAVHICNKARHHLLQEEEKSDSLHSPSYAEAKRVQLLEPIEFFYGESRSLIHMWMCADTHMYTHTVGLGFNLPCFVQLLGLP